MNQEKWFSNLIESNTKFSNRFEIQIFFDLEYLIRFKIILNNIELFQIKLIYFEYWLKYIHWIILNQTDQILFDLFGNFFKNLASKLSNMPNYSKNMQILCRLLSNISNVIRHKVKSNKSYLFISIRLVFGKKSNII